MKFHQQVCTRLYVLLMSSVVEKENRDGTKVLVPVLDLTIPKCGLEHTIYLDVGNFAEGYSHATRRFKMLSDVFFFRNLAGSMIYELFSYIEEYNYKAGELIVEWGEESDSFFVIES